MLLSAERLLLVCCLFETRALKKLGQLNRDAEHSLFTNLKWLIRKDISYDAYNEWLAKNASVLGNISNYDWYSGGTMIASDSGDDITHLIYKDNFNDPSFVIYKESILIGHSEIPKLNYISGKWEKPSSGLDLLPPEFSHEAFLVKALSSISYRLISDKFIKEVEAYYKENKDKINSLRKLFAKPPVYLGGGSDGMAFDIGNNLVLKIFQDKYSYNAARDAQERLHKFPEIAKTEAMIYDVGQLGPFGKHNVFYSIIEKMKTIDNNGPSDESMRSLLSLIHKEIDPLLISKEWINYKKNIKDPKIYPILQLKAKKAAEVLSKIIGENHSHIVKKIESMFELNNDWLANLVEEILMKWLTGRGDLHPGNMGVTNYGIFRYFDPAYSGWTEQLNLPEF